MLRKIYFVSVKIHVGEAKPLSSWKNCHWLISDILKNSSIQFEKTPKFQYTYKNSSLIFVRISPKTESFQALG